MENSTRLFRKAAFGGFNRDDVMAYIEEQKRTFADYKAEVEETISDLKEKLALLESAQPGISADAAQNSVSDLSETTDRLKAVADALSCSLDRLIDRFSFGTEPKDDEPADAPADLVSSVLSNLYAEKAPAPAQKTSEKSEALEDVLPNYLFV